VGVIGIEVCVSLTDLKRAFRRLLARLPDESEKGSEFIIFRAHGKNLDVTTGGTSETLIASVVHPGLVIVPCSIFRGVARTLRFFRGNGVTIASSTGMLRIARTEFRHPNISVLAPGAEHAIVGTKPAKLQNP
jgi:hypothetical protein